MVERIITPSRVNSPNTPSRTPSAERAVSSRSSKSSPSLFPEGVTPFKTIAAPRRSHLDLKTARVAEPNPDRVYKLPALKSKKSSLMPAGVTPFINISSAGAIQKVSPEQKKITTLPQEFTESSRSIPRFNPNISPRGRVQEKIIAKPSQKNNFWPEGITHKTIIPSSVVKGRLSTTSVRSVKELPKKSINNRTDTYTAPVFPKRGTIFSAIRPERPLKNVSFTPFSTLKRELPVSNLSPSVQKEKVFALQYQPHENRESVASKIHPVVPRVTMEVPLNPNHLNDKLNKAPQLQKEVVVKTVRNEKKTKQIRTIQKEQLRYKVVVRESMRQAKATYESFRTMGLSPRVAYEKSGTALREILVKENVSPVVIARVMSLRTQRNQRRLQTETLPRLQVSLKQRAEIQARRRLLTKEVSPRTSTEHRVTGFEMIIIEHLPTKKLRDIIFNTAIDSLPGNKATLQDVVSAVMSHPLMSKMNSPLLYSVYPSFMMSKYLLDGLLLDRLRNWENKKESHTKEELRSMVGIMLNNTPAIIQTLNKPDSPLEIDESTIYTVVNGDVTEPDIQKN